MKWALCLLLALFVSAAQAQDADTVFVNGTIVTFDGTAADALAVRGERIAAIGSSADIRKLAGSATRVIDLGGRTVIPGLIDSHIHAIRAGLTFTTEVHWTGARSIPEALDRLRDAAREAPKGAWLVVAGGWIETQFAERRRPTQAEIAAAAPDHHVYVQLLYSAVLLSPDGAEALGVTQDAERAARLKFDAGADGKPTGWISADNRTISELFDLLPQPTMEQQVIGTRTFFRRLNSFGITGVLDPGGYNMPLSGYEAVQRLWRYFGLSVRVVYSLCAPRPGQELEDFKIIAAASPQGSGDAWLKFNGIGENVTWRMYNNETPTEDDKQRLYDVLRWAAPQGLTATFHWHNDRSVPHLLDVLERVNRETPIAPLRWSIAHLNDASHESLARMKALGVGWLMQNAFYFRGEAFLGQRGLDAARLAPPIASALRMGIPVGGGTDAHRVMDYNPFVSLQWMLDGKTVGGVVMRAAAETPSRLDALRLYTQGSAWFSHEERERGELAAGKLADLAVLSADYLSVPVDEIGGIRSTLTMVGGRIVHTAEPFASFATDALRTTTNP